MIQLHNGEARLPDSRYATGYRELSSDARPVVYGLLRPARLPVAALYLACSTGGETAGDTLQDNYVIFDGENDRLQPLAVITPQVQGGGQSGAAVLLGNLKISSGAIEIEEHYYLPGDAMCCPLGVARTTWTFANGHLVAGNPKLVAAGQSISVTGNVSGQDYEGVEWAHDLITDCARHAYGSAMITFLQSHPCTQASRHLLTLSYDNRQVALSIITVEFPDAAALTDHYRTAGEFASLEQKGGTGSINDLLREGHIIPDGPTAIPSTEAFHVRGQDSGVTIFDAWYLDGHTEPQAPELIRLEDDLFLTAVTVG